MLTGLTLILFGILVALLPQILVAIVSSMLILTGLGICAMSWNRRRLRRTSHSSIVNWMFRF